MKTTVKEGNWSDIKKQFMGAYQNALAIAGFLNISINTDEVSLYTVYRNDKINNFANPVAIRYDMHDKSRNEPIDWNSKHVISCPKSSRNHPKCNVCQQILNFVLKINTIIKRFSNASFCNQLG